MFVRCLAMMRGGGETRHLAWARELRRLGDEVQIITGRPLLRNARIEPDDSHLQVLRTPYVRDLVYRVQGKRVLGRIGSWALHLDEELFTRAAWSTVARLPQPVDIVHAHALHQTGRLRRGSTSVVVNLPGPPHARYVRDLASADALVSDGWGSAHLPGILRLPVDDVPKGVDTDQFAPDGPSLRTDLGLGGRPVVLAVGRLVPIKRFDVLIKAFARLVAQCPDAVLLVVGDGPERGGLTRLVGRLGVAESVRLVGHVQHEQLPSWYRSADVFALSSQFDNSPNVLLEAMSSGVPIVSTDVGGVRHYVKPGINGELVPSGSSEELARSLLTLLDRNRGREIGRANRQEVVERYSWSNSAAHLRRVYERVLGENRSGHVREPRPASVRG